MNRHYIPIISFFLFPHFNSHVIAQAADENRNGLHIISNVKTYSNSIRNNPGMKMTDLKREIPGIQFDLRYATKRNFTGKKIYPGITTTYMRKIAADKLRSIQKKLSLLGLGIRVFDAYRPYHCTEKLWELVKDERYAANPAKGSNHNRGIAIDLTLIRLESGKPLDMGVDFDNFTDSAHHDFTGFPAAILKNRQLLKDIMMAHGFQPLASEWWHYTLPDAQKYELLDLDFAEFRN